MKNIHYRGLIIYYYEQNIGISFEIAFLMCTKTLKAQQNFFSHFQKVLVIVWIL